MIQVGGATYRIERCAPHRYTVVRLLDDLEVGTFRTFPRLRIQPSRVELSLFRQLVRAALRSARTSVVMHVAPVYAPEDEAPTSSSARSPSSLPPPTPALA
jgi:hypothetical protein